MASDIPEFEVVAVRPEKRSVAKNRPLIEPLLLTVNQKGSSLKFKPGQFTKLMLNSLGIYFRKHTSHRIRLSTDKEGNTYVWLESLDKSNPSTKTGASVELGGKT
jgi:hypothetical protein